MTNTRVRSRDLARLGVTNKRLLRITSSESNGPCWLWLGNKQKDTGVPYKVWFGLNIPARRWLYELLLGPIPPGKIVSTRCGTSDCCNPAHLKLTTRLEVARETLSDLTQGDRDDILAMAKQVGKAPTAIARALDLEAHVVRKYLDSLPHRELSQVRINATTLSEEKREAIKAAAIELGNAPGAIAARVGVCRSTVRMYLQKLPPGTIKEKNQMVFKPMKGDAFDPAKAVFPYIGSNKIDGLRCLIRNGQALTSALKPHPNKFIQEFFADGRYDGLDGELTCGEPNKEETFRLAATLRKSTGQPDFRFYVFDDFSDPDAPYDQRCVTAQRKIAAGENGSKRVYWVDTFHVPNQGVVDQFTATALSSGYEGIMLRHPTGRYKFGRSTVGENLLLKEKPWADAECRIIGLVEQQTNTNAKTTNELGRSKRSSAKAGKINAGTLGAFKVVGINGQYKGVEFEIGSGTGLTHAMRQKIWDDSKSYLGRVMTYRFQDLGGYDKPRIPQFKAFRPESEVK